MVRLRSAAEMGSCFSLDHEVFDFDCCSEDSFVVVNHVKESSSSIVENRPSRSAHCTGSQSEKSLYLNRSEECLARPAASVTAINDIDEMSGLTPTSPSHEAVRTKIENGLRGHYATLVNSIDPVKLARHLYGSRIIDDDQLEAATNRYVARGDRAGTLLQQLIRKLKANPQWCGKAVAAMERAGVNVASIVEDLRREGVPVEIAAVHSHGENMLEDIITFSREEDIATFRQGGDITRFWMKLDLRECGIQDKGGNTPLHIVAVRGDMSILEQILESNFPFNIINCVNKDGQTALHVGVRNQSVAVTRRLCAYRTCDPYVFDNEGRTALHYACKSTDLVRPLLKLCSKSRFIDATDKNGNTALHLATMGNCIDVMKLLRKSKANLKIRNYKQQRPIDIAKESGDQKTILMLAKWTERLRSRFRKGSEMKKSSSTTEMSPSYPSMDSIDSQARSSIYSAFGVQEVDDYSSDDDIN